jgi:hypothetical protein
MVQRMLRVSKPLQAKQPIFENVDRPMRFELGAPLRKAGAP